MQQKMQFLTKIWGAVSSFGIGFFVGVALVSIFYSFVAWITVVNPAAAAELWLTADAEQFHSMTWLANNWPMACLYAGLFCGFMKLMMDHDQQ